MNGIEFLESVSRLGQLILVFSCYAVYWKLGRKGSEDLQNSKLCLGSL